MLAGANAGNIRAEATALSGNIFDEAMRTMEVDYLQMEKEALHQPHIQVVQCGSNHWTNSNAPIQTTTWTQARLSATSTRHRAQR